MRGSGCGSAVAAATALAFICTSGYVRHVLLGTGSGVEDDGCRVAHSYTRLFAWWMRVYLGRTGACTFISNTSSQRYRDLIAGELSVRHFSRRRSASEHMSLARQGVPMIDAASLTDAAGMQKLMSVIASSRFHAAVITNAFHAHDDLAAITNAHAAAGARYTANNGRFASRYICSEQSMGSRQASLLTLDELFGSSAKLPTDMHIFHAVPSVKATGGRGSRQCRAGFAVGSVEAHLLERVLAGNSTRIGFPLARVLNRGNRRIFSAMRPGTGVQFHEHSATWFALTHGRKAWWLGEPASAPLWRTLGSAAGMPSSCEYLRALEQRPDPQLVFLVQEAGEIVVFGEGVAHATCALNASVGVGIQMGYSTSPHITAKEPLRCMPTREQTASQRALRTCINISAEAARRPFLLRRMSNRFSKYQNHLHDK